ncbi:hypothetical protein K402DRAFT_392317 [Aulographum hederae CBS 113979]|uniref:Uncharacterized protein n=1 Tax=Aulographum hederae CBS 113979 TaxID=1176131 RepID=A0A6G1H4Q9_9PEZI|nr:hypothetical protein K402DRAFT_392317 [Aulographum hederae CBS 113979]
MSKPSTKSLLPRCSTITFNYKPPIMVSTRSLSARALLIGIGASPPCLPVSTCRSILQGPGPSGVCSLYAVLSVAFFPCGGLCVPEACSTLDSLS